MKRIWQAQGLSPHLGYAILFFVFKEKIIQFWHQHHSRIIFLLTLLAGLWIFTPYTDYQAALAQGDHGRDLYAFQQTLNGAVPYRDYWWVYGPFMPSYYALFFKLFGMNIKSILIGKALLHLLSGIFFYLTLRSLIPAALSFIGTIWFWTFFPDFLFTYNHIGGIVMILATTYCLLSYIKTHKPCFFGWGAFSVLMLSFIKINMGFSALIGFGFTILVDHHFRKGLVKNKTYWTVMIGIPVLTIAVYWICLKGLPLYAIRQCLPYLDIDHPYNEPFIQTIRLYSKMIFSNIPTSTSNTTFAVIIIGSILQTSYLVLRKKMDQTQRNQLLLSLLGLLVFGILNLHEFLKSGVIYRSFWAKPLFMLMTFIFIAVGTRNLQRVIRFTLYSTIALISILHVFKQHQNVRIVKTPEHYISSERGQVFTNNPYQWHRTVHQTSHYLQTHLKSDETLFAIPYDPLYYFLTDKKSPTRQTIFFEHINIPPEQEKKIILELEKNNINYILLSNRLSSSEQGLGTFGQTHCLVLANYIKENFEPVAVFGDWQNQPGWAWNHSTKILKRIRP